MRTVAKAAMLVVSSLLFVCLAWAGEVQVYTDLEIRPALLEFVNGAERSLDVEMYVLTDTQVIDAMERAEDRGVQVRLILDPNQSGNQKHVERMKQRGVEVKWFPIKKPALMHRKLAIVDRTKFFAGSVNWTHNGLANNEELMLIVEDPKVAQQLDEVFDGDWAQAWLGHYVEYR